ncbi:MAG: HD domain-containing protein, partial [Lachnospiraceae bacterium]|nr:HD domain-containing protein [Lachnospiraceae bacterium]
MEKRSSFIRNRLTPLFRRIYGILIGDHDLWQQLLNIAVMIAIGGALVSAVISVALGNSPIAIAAFLFTALFGAFCLILSIKASDVIYAAVAFSLVANFILFPIMFFTSGGYHGGMPLWMLLSLVLSWVVIRRRILYVVYGLGLLFTCGCILYSEKHPKAVVFFQSEHAVAMDVIQSLVLVSLILGIIIKYQGLAYEKKKDELDKANAFLAETNERITLQSMYTLAKTIDAKDRYTNGHSMRVAKYSGMLSMKMGLPEEEVEEITNMAMLHDIGKIGVPDAIINKTSFLTPEEYDIVKGHSVIGYEILSEMPEMKDIGTGARWHH